MKLIQNVDIKTVFADETSTKLVKSKLGQGVYLLAQVDPTIPGVEPVIMVMNQIYRDSGLVEVKFDIFKSYYDRLDSATKTKLHEYFSDALLIVIDIRELESSLEETVKELRINIPPRIEIEVLKRPLIQFTTSIETIAEICQIVKSSLSYLNPRYFLSSDPSKVVDLILTRLGNKLQNIFRFVAEYNSIFWKLYDKQTLDQFHEDMEKLYKEWSYFPPLEIRLALLLSRIFDRNYVFDEGNKKSMATLKLIYDDVKSTIDNLRSYLLPVEYSKKSEIKSLKSGNSQYLQIADIVVGFAREMFDKGNIDAVKNEFKKVIYNGRPL